MANIIVAVPAFLHWFVYDAFYDEGYAPEQPVHLAMQSMLVNSVLIAVIATSMRLRAAMPVRRRYQSVWAATIRQRVALVRVSLVLRRCCRLLMKPVVNMRTYEDVDGKIDDVIKVGAVVHWIASTLP